MTATTNPNKALWEKGDFTQIAASMRESGEALVKSFGIRKGLKVLDLGCGDGTTALPAARLGANVLGVDIATTGEEAVMRAMAIELGAGSVALVAAHPSPRRSAPGSPGAPRFRGSARRRGGLVDEQVAVAGFHRVQAAGVDGPGRPYTARHGVAGTE